MNRIRAISGEAAFQVERSALGHATLPEDFARALDDHATRDNGMPELPTLSTRLQRAPGLVVRAQAVLGDGRFEMGHVITGNGRDDLPVSKLAADVARCACGGPLGELLPDVDHDALLSTAQALIADDVLVRAD